MAEETNDNSQQRDVASTNWSALEADESFSENVTETTEEQPGTEEKPDENQENQEGAESNQDAENKADGEEKPEEKEKAEEAPAGEEKPKEEEAAPFIEFKAEDVTGLEPEPEDGTWLALAKAQGVDIKEDNFEAYQEAIESKYNAKIEEVKQMTKETIFAELKPETVAALKLIEMGIPEESVFAPTKQIDQWLGLEDEVLVREDLKAQNWDDEKIDTEIEILIEKGWLKHTADKIKGQLAQTREQIVSQRESILQQYEENKQKVSLQQKEENTTQIKKALDTVSSFMNGKISPEAKQVIWEKYTKGMYEKDLNDPQSRVEFLLYKEFGPRAIKHLENTAYQRGRDEKTAKLLNIPPVKEGIANKAKETKQINNWSAIEEDFGAK